MKHEQEKKWSANELWDKFNLITKKIFLLYKPPTDTDDYKHGTSKLSNGVTRRENTLPLKMLKLKFTTSAKNFNILKQNQYLKR